MNAPAVWVKRVRPALATTFADAFPQAAIDLLWARGDHERVYGLIENSPLAIARFAALDGDAARAEAKTREAVKAARTRFDLVKILSSAPIHLGDEQALLRCARNLQPWGEPKLVWLIWLRRDIPSRYEPIIERAEREPIADEDDVALACFAAAWLADAGETERAAALFSRLAESQVGLEELLPIVIAHRGWPVEVLARHPSAILHAARARQDDLVEALASRDGVLASTIAPAVIARADAPDSWRKALLARSVFEVRQEYDEGLITWNELWTFRVARAVAEGDPRSMLIECANEAREATEAAGRWIKTVLGGGPIFPEELDHLRARFEKARAQHAAKPILAYRVLGRIVALGDAGFHTEAAEALASVEPHLRARDRELSDYAIALAACPGRAREAQELAAKDAVEDQLRIALALAQERRLDECRAILDAIVATDVRSILELVLLGSAIVMVDPSTTKRLSDAIDRVLASLPGSTNQPLAEWLSRPAAAL